MQKQQKMQNMKTINEKNDSFFVIDKKSNINVLLFLFLFLFLYLYLQSINCS